jgi:hypothetical protein
MMTRTERDKMLAGDLYDAGAPELQADAAATHEWLARYNAAFGAPISPTLKRTSAGAARCQNREYAAGIAINLPEKRSRYRSSQTSSKRQPL